jgi:hypothetical protein
MILRALERGVQEAHLARALDVNIGTIRNKRNLLDGICPEVVELLKEQQFSTKVAQLLRKMKPARQIECAELMCSLRNFSISYAQALLAATPQAQLVEAQRSRWRGWNRKCRRCKAGSGRLKPLTIRMC